MTAPPPATPAHVPTALVRSSGGNVVVMIDNVAGIVIAAPTPANERSAISIPASVVRAARA